MNGWLDGKRAHLVGEAADIAEALLGHGATLAGEGDGATAGSDILIYVADVPERKAVHLLAHEEWRATLDGGLDRCFHLARAFAVERRAAGKAGAIVFVGAPEQALGSDQAAAAGALGNLVKTLGVEWARDGIRVNAIRTFERGAALGNLAAYLASDYAAYITGAVMGVVPGDV